MAESIGFATLQIIPSMLGISGNLQGEFSGPLVAAGRRAGQDAGQAVATGIASAKASVDKATEALARSQDKVADAAGKVRVAEAKLLELRNSSKTTAAQMAAAEERVESALRGAATASRNAETAASSLATAQERAANATDEVVSGSNRASGGLKSMFSGMGSGTKQLAGLAAGMAGVGAAGELMGKAMEQGATGSKLAASFGESAEEAKRYGEVAGNLYADGVGSSMEDISGAVAAVGGAFGSLDSMGAGRLEQLSAKASGFAQIFDQDVSSSVQAASQLMTNGLAANADEAFDLMTRGMQEVSVSMRDELPEILNEYGTNFRALGFDGKESFNMLIAASQGGAIALDKTGDALKEFTILGSDMSESSKGTYEAIGLNAQEMSNAVAAGGEGAQAALQQTAAGLLAIEDPSARANAAIALFGAPLEDLSVDQIPGFLAGLAGAEDVIGGFEGSLDGSIGVLNDNAGSAFETFKRGLEQNVTSMLGDNVLPLLGDFTGALDENEGSALAAVAGMTGMSGAVAGFETAKGAFDSVKEGAMGLKDGFMSAKETATGLVDGAKTVGTTVATATTAITTQTTALASSAAAHTRQAGAFIASKTALVAGTVATGAATAAQWLFNVALNANPISLIVIAVAGLVAGLVYFFTQTELGQKIVTAAWDAILAGWNWMYDKVSAGFTAFGNGIGYIGEKATEAKDWVVGKFNDLVGFITGLPGRISSAASGM